MLRALLRGAAPPHAPPVRRLHKPCSTTLRRGSPCPTAEAAQPFTKMWKTWVCTEWKAHSTGGTPV